MINDAVALMLRVQLALLEHEITALKRAQRDESHGWDAMAVFSTMLYIAEQQHATLAKALAELA